MPSHDRGTGPEPGRSESWPSRRWPLRRCRWSRCRHRPARGRHGRAHGHGAGGWSSWLRRRLRRLRPIGRWERPRPEQQRRAQKSRVILRTRRVPTGRRDRGGSAATPPGGRTAPPHRRPPSRTWPPRTTPAARRRSSGAGSAPGGRRRNRTCPSGRRSRRRHRHRRSRGRQRMIQRSRDWLTRGGDDCGHPANLGVAVCGRRHRPRRPRSGPALPRPAPAAPRQPVRRRPGGPPERSRRTWNLSSGTRAGPARRHPAADTAPRLVSGRR